ncbi:MAG TPA: hypothetical protein VFN83_11045, partial [Gemmatimonadales bacterium]|nr:hypothetical protein [Gemmatimonadales bacterium]
MDRSRREFLIGSSLGLASLALARPLYTLGATWPGAAGPDQDRLRDWIAALRAAELTARAAPLGTAAIRVGELARGTPYVPYTLEEYLK